MEQATDFLVVPTREATADELRQHPPLGAGGVPFQLNELLVVNRLESSVSDRLMDECTPGNLKATRQFGQRYTFVREDAPTDRPYDWDSDQEITIAIALSRLVRSNAYSTQFAVREVDYGATQKFIPLHGEGAFYGYMLDPSQRDWLDVQEGEGLRKLCAAYRSNSEEWGARERRAFRLCEDAARKPFLDDAAMTMVTALEALLHTKIKHSTRQFVERTVQLAGQLGVAAFTREAAEAIYEFRSAAVHGSGSEGNEDNDLQNQIAATQVLLRKTVAKIVLEPDFAEVFRSVEKIRQAYPI